MEMPHYRPSSLVIVKPLIEYNPGVKGFFWKTNAGCCGDGGDASPLNMKTTADMVGRSSESSSTHNNPT